MFEDAWEAQTELQKLQDDINEAIWEVQTAVSSVLKASTIETLQQYQAIFEAIVNRFEPTMAVFDELEVSACRKNAENILTFATDHSGFAISNCANDYNTSVSGPIEEARNSAYSFNSLYNQVQTIVVKSFVGQNKFTDAEDINDLIKSMFALVDGKWKAEKPNLKSITENLASSIKIENVKLGVCHEETMASLTSFYDMFVRSVTTCRDFNNSRPSGSKSSKAAGKPEWEIVYEEFLALVEKVKSEKAL